MMHGSCDINCDGQCFEKSTQKIKTLKKLKNSWRYYHFTHMCNINYNYINGSCDIERERLNVFFILDHCLPFYPLPSPPPLPIIQNIKTLKKWKNARRYYHFTHMCTINYNYMIYGSSDIKRNGQSFEKSTQKIKFL